MSKNKEQSNEQTEQQTPTAEVGDTTDVLSQLKTLNETLFRCGQLLSSIDDRLSGKRSSGPSPAVQADARRPLANKVAWSNNVAGGWQ